MGSLEPEPNSLSPTPLVGFDPLWMQGKQLRKRGLHRTAVFEEQQRGDGGGGDRNPPL